MQTDVDSTAVISLMTLWPCQTSIYGSLEMDLHNAFPALPGPMLTDGDGG